MVAAAVLPEISTVAREAETWSSTSADFTCASLPVTLIASVTVTDPTFAMIADRPFAATSVPASPDIDTSAPSATTPSVTTACVTSAKLPVTVTVADGVAAPLSVTPPAALAACRALKSAALMLPDVSVTAIAASLSASRMSFRSEVTPGAPVS